MYVRKTRADLMLKNLRWRPGPPTYLPTYLIWYRFHPNMGVNPNMDGDLGGLVVGEVGEGVEQG